MFSFDWSTRLFPQLPTSRRRGARRQKLTGASSRRRLGRELLENRCLLSAVTVTDSSDVSDGNVSNIAALISNPGSDGGISLREAILASNNTPGANTITFAPDLTGQTITLTQGEYLVSNALTIAGLPAAGTTLDGNYASRLFDITAAATAVTLDGLTLTRGQVPNGGGSALRDGGAIYSESALTVNNSSISSSYGEGGAIYTLGDVTVTNSSIGQNYTAGIDSVSGKVTVSNSTVYYNGVGIVAEHGPLTVTNSTVVDNSVGIQAGTLASEGPVSIRSSIVASGYYSYDYRGYTYYSVGTDLSYGSAVTFAVSNSLIGNNAGSGLIEAPVGAPDSNGNFIGGPIHGAIDPKLPYLGYNGGPTETMLPQPGSPAIDTGANPDNLATDERGLPRTAGATTDMGAVELQTSLLTPTMSISAPDHAFGGPGPVVAVAGVNGPAQPYLEGVPVTTNYYQGTSASGTSQPYPPYEVGTYTVVASFAGSAEYSAASQSSTFTITKAPTTTTVADYYHHRVSGQDVPIWVNIAADPGAGVIDSGVVTLWDGGTLLFSHNIDYWDYEVPGSVLSGNSVSFGLDQVAFSSSGLSVGTHTLTATYSGDSHHLGSTSTTFSLAIDQASTTTSVYSSPDPSVEPFVGQDVTFTAYVAVVSPGSGIPTGTMSFWDGTTLLGTATVAGTGDSYYHPGQATFTTHNLSIGTHNIIATYSGDANFKVSTADGISVPIRRAETVTVTSSAFRSTASYGQNVTLTANVSVVDPSISAPTGTVQFQMDGQDLGSPAQVNATGNGSITTSSIPLGNHRISAVYSGNTAIDTSTGFLPGTISTFAGNGTGEYLLPTSANNTVLLSPNALATDNSGDIFVADGSQFIRKLDAKTGIVSTFGPTVNLYNVEYYPAQVGLVCDAADNLFVADPGDNVVEKVTPSGVVTIVAGALRQSYGYDSGDGGPATAATLGAPSGLAFDAAGDLFIADAGSGTIRKINSAGIISTVAGGGSSWDPILGYIGNGDGGLATSAVLYNPTGIAVDAAGNLFISDVGDYDIRKVDHATGTISTLVDQWVYAPALAVNSAGNLFYDDAYNQVIKEVNPAGVISTAAGSGTSGYSGDGGLATSAQLNYPVGLALDAAGNLFIADAGNQVIREVNAASTISTVVGGGTLGTAGNGGPAIDAVVFAQPDAIASDPAGDLFIANLGVVREVSPAGIITKVAGNGLQGYSGDGGAASAAELDSPSGLALDSAGDLFIIDSGNNVVRKVTPAGVITTVAGSGTAGYSGDGGPATAAELDFGGTSFGAIAVDAAGDLFIADGLNGAIRKVDAQTGVITTIATGFAYPTALAINAAGDLFVAELIASDVREVTPAGTISTVAGAGYYYSGYSGDGGPAAYARLNYPTGLAFDAAGDLLIADEYNFVIRAVSPAGIITTVAGGGTFGAFGAPMSIATDAAGDLFIADYGGIRKVSPSLVVTQDATSMAVGSSSSSPVFGQAVTFTASVDSIVPGVGTPSGTVQLMVDGLDFGNPLTLGANGTASLTTSALPVGSHTITAVYSGNAQFQASTGVLTSGTIETVIGTGVAGYSGDGGPAISAQLNQLPEGLAFDSAGNLYIADLYNQVIRKVAPAGTITTVAGNGTDGYSGDGGPATAAQFNYPFDVAVDSLGDLFIDDCVNNVIREVFPNGIITTVAGNGNGGYSGDGVYATDAELYRPAAIAVDQFGDLFIADGLNHVVREVTPDGIIHTVVGNGTAGNSGDGGLATVAEMYSPDGLAVDSVGDLFISDYWENVIREVTSDGIIHTIAGNGVGGETGGGGYSGDGGPATAAELYNPEFIRLDAAGDLFISDGGNNVIREVRAGIITTVAGTGVAGYTGDGGPATAAELGAYPAGLAVDAYGDLFIADATNNVIREVTPTLYVSPDSSTTTVASSSSTSVVGQGVTFTATIVAAAPGSGTPTGTVTFWDGSTELGTATLGANGQAAFKTSGLSLGTHTITASYSGNADFDASVSLAISQTVLSSKQEAGMIVNQVNALTAAGILSKGNGNALVSTLSNATASLNRGNTTSGINQLNAFINQVQALVKSHKLDGADAQTLINSANLAIAGASVK